MSPPWKTSPTSGQPSPPIFVGSASPPPPICWAVTPMRCSRTCAGGRASATTPASSTRSSPPCGSWREGRRSPGGRTRRNENATWRLAGQPPTRISEGGMIFRLSHKLNAKIKAGVLQALLLHVNPLADWSAHLFVAGRTQYLLLSNTKSLYSTVMYGRGVTTDSHFIERALGGIREFMAQQGERLIPSFRSLPGIASAPDGSCPSTIPQGCRPVASGQSRRPGTGGTARPCPRSSGPRCR